LVETLATDRPVISAIDAAFLVLEVEEHHLSIEWTQTLNQCVEPVQRATTIDALLAIDDLSESIQILRVYRDERRRSGPRPDDPRDRGVVGHAIHPRAQRAAAVIASQAPPQGDVNVLQQVASSVRVSFVAAGQPLERGAERCAPLPRSDPPFTSDSRNKSQHLTRASTQFLPSRFWRKKGR
jgi:hypothetical protein